MLISKPDVVHVHDWHTAAVPVFLNTLYRNDPLFKDTASVLTIHSIQHQGIFYKGLMDVLGVGNASISPIVRSEYSRPNTQLVINANPIKPTAAVI